MASNFNQAQENQATNNLFFESNQSPIVSLLNKVFMEDSGIVIESPINDKQNNVLEAVNAKFVYTNKCFVLEIIHQEDFLVNIILKGEDTLTEEELTILKKLMNQLNDFGFCFYVDNEKETLNFDSLLYGTKKEEPIKIKSASTNTEDIWTKITERMKELKMPAKLMNRIRVQRWHLINKYGDDYVNYIGEYAEKQFNEYIKSNNIKPKNNEEVWANISQKMKDANLPFKFVNRIRVQKSNFQKKYGNDYTSYIEEYANKQIEDYLKG